MAVNRFDHLIDHWDERLRKAFLEAVQNLRDQAQIEQIVKMLERDDIEGAMRALNQDPVAFRVWDKAFHDAFEAGGIVTSSAIPPVKTASGLRVVFRFNVRNPAAEDFLRDHSGNVIREIMDDQKLLVRNHLVAGMEKGLNPRTVALDLVGRVGPRGVRMGGVIGLTNSQAQWVRNYASELLDDPAASLTRTLRDKRFDAVVKRALANEEPIPLDTRLKMVTAYENRALRYRAETIARKEAITALHTAQEQAVDQAIASGLDQETVTFQWHTAHDDRVRSTHRPMDGQVRAYGKPFVTGGGAYLEYPGDPNGPAAEVINCRCWREPKVDFLRGIR